MDGVHGKLLCLYWCKMKWIWIFLWVVSSLAVVVPILIALSLFALGQQRFWIGGSVLLGFVGFVAINLFVFILDEVGTNKVLSWWPRYFAGIPLGYRSGGAFLLVSGFYFIVYKMMT